MTFIGIPNKHRKFVRYLFCRWNDKKVEEKYQKSVRWLVDDIMAQRSRPHLDFDMYISYEGDDTKRHSIETLPDTILEIMFDDRHVTPEKIEAFFNSTGIIIKRADPFYIKLSMANRIFNILTTPVLFPIELILNAVSRQK